MNTIYSENCATACRIVYLGRLLCFTCLLFSIQLRSHAQVVDPLTREQAQVDPFQRGNPFLPESKAKPAVEIEQTTVLSFEHVLERDELSGANRLELSRDGSRLYVAPWRTNAVITLLRKEAGKLEFGSTSPTRMQEGVISLDLASEMDFLAAICLRSKTLLLFETKPGADRLRPEGYSNTELTWPVSVQFSHDSKFLYVVDAKTTGAGSTDSQIVGYAVSESGGIREIARFQHEELVGAREVFMSPGGEFAYASCSSGGAILVLKRDIQTGKLSHLQTLDESNSECKYLTGVHAATTNRDGSRVYFVSGRFLGESGITVFDRLADGQLRLKQQCPIESESFSGGNHLAITQDEKLIFASGTTGNSLAVVRQDLDNNKLELDGYLVHNTKQNLEGPSGLLLVDKEDRLYVAVEDGSAVASLAIHRK